jgi:hypothetical protein
LSRLAASETKPDADQTESWAATWALLALLAVGALFGFLILLGGYSGWNYYHRHFVHTSAFLLWAGLMCAQTGLWVVALVWLFPSLRRQWSARSFFSSEILLSIFAIAAIATAFVVVSQRTRHSPDYIPGHTWRLITLTTAGLVVGLVAASGIWLARDGLRRLGQQPLSAENDKTTALRLFLICKDDLDRFLGALGAILGLLVLTTAAHRQMVLSYVTYAAYHKQPGPGPTGTIMPIRTEYGFQLVLLYGLFFTILVAAVYLPTHLTRIRVGDRIGDAYFPAVLPDSPEWISRSASRDQLAGVLGIRDGPLSQFKAVVPIVTPLIAALIGLLLK